MRLISWAAAMLAAAPVPLWAQSTTSYTYDDFGRLKVVSHPSGAKTGYQYDAADNRTRVQAALNGVLNLSPVCGPHHITITGVPQNVPTITITGSITNSSCIDPDGDTLTVTNPTTAPVFTLSQGQSYSYSLTVSDGRGGTASGTRIYTRQ